MILKILYFTDNCDQIYHCIDKSDEFNCFCRDLRAFQCECYKNNPPDCATNSLTSNQFKGCIPIEEQNDGIGQCPDGSDENFRIKKRIICGQCDVTIYRLTNIVECNINLPFTCDASTCYNVSSLHCSPINCHETDFICMSNCPAKQCNRGFQCDDGSLGVAFQFCDGEINCHDASDEIQHQHGFKCFGLNSTRKCVLPQRNLYDNVAQCRDESDLCKNNSCFLCFDRRLLISSKQVCDGLFDCYDWSDENFCQNNLENNLIKSLNRNFHCDDGSLGLAFQFCDGEINCHDASDEIQHQHGFKCVGLNSSRKCVLPQRNLHDTVAQCRDQSDLCKNNSCFQCFDRRLLISSKQICDGLFDCYDWSDECLCEHHFNLKSCNTRFSSCNWVIGYNIFNFTSNFDYKRIITVKEGITKSTKTCQSKAKDNDLVTLCDGRPECSNLSDECNNCENPPKFCNYSCHNDYNIGDRYCDGIEDDFYGITDKLNCFKGFDELHCLKRFFCKAGKKISIDVDQICDGKQDCDDNTDEKKCNNTFNSVFSSAKKMIANIFLESCFWIMGMAVIGGNIYVIISTTYHLKISKLNKSLKYQHLIILNISIADIIMGFYLLTIAVYSVYYSGYYGQIDLKWRSSLSCSIIGSLAVLSSEASCLLMVLLTSCRLYVIYKPFSTLSTSTWKYKLAIISVWLISVIIAVLPILHQTSEYFVHSVEFSNRFTRSQIWNKENITKFACRLAGANNQSMKNNKNDWNFTKTFLKTNYPEYSPGVEFGYYGQTSVCMPRFYVYRGEHAWEYTLAVITINFLSFFFIATSYIFMFIRSSKNKLKTKNNQREKQQSRKRRRISRIIITDFLCWIPICIMAFVKLSGFYVDDVAYVVSAGLLLPINSAFNPLLYSSLLDKLTETFQNLPCNHKTQQ